MYWSHHTNRREDLKSYKEERDYGEASFEVPTVVNMQSAIFWSVTPYSPIDHRRLGQPPLPETKTKPSKRPLRKKHSPLLASWRLAGCFLGLVFQHEDTGSHVPLKGR
jgi:hypothetical protein